MFKRCYFKASQRCLSFWYQFVSNNLFNAVVCSNHPVCLLESSGYLAVMHFLCVSHTLQSASESGQDSIIVQIHWSIAFDRVNHQGIRNKLCSAGIGGSAFSIYWHSFCQIDHSTVWWTVVEANWFTLCQECRRAVFLGPLLFLLVVHLGAF